MLGILGKKIGMTRIIQDDGCVIPLTVVECTPNVITQVKTPEKDGYPAIVLGFDAFKKPFKTQKFRHIREFKIEVKSGEELPKKGDEVKVDVFTIGDRVSVTGTSKGKGFQGVIKRHHFSGGRATHGSHFHREPGSIGMRAKPGCVNKGHKMAGHMGDEKVTVSRVQIAYVDPEKNLIGVKGPVPGATGCLVIIRKSRSAAK